MRLLKTLINPFVLMSLTFFLSCTLTEDPPPPDRLSAPYFTDYQIIAVPDYTNEYHETIYLQWAPDSTDPISPISYEIIRQADTDSLPSYIRNIPDTVNEVYEPTYKFDELDRFEEHLIFYSIFAYDSLGRVSDTSVICTVSLARSLTLMHPEIIMSDIPGTEYFKWEVPEHIQDWNVSHVLLWKKDSLIWESDSAWHYTGGSAEYPEKKLPNNLSPLEKITYYWGIEFAILRNNDPVSITIGKFTVE